MFELLESEKTALDTIKAFIDFAVEHKSTVFRVDTNTKNVMLAIECHDLKNDDIGLLSDMLKISKKIGGNIDIRHFLELDSIEPAIWYDLHRFLREVSRDSAIQLIRENYPSLLEWQEVPACQP